MYKQLIVGAACTELLYGKNERKFRVRLRAWIWKRTDIQIFIKIRSDNYTSKCAVIFFEHLILLMDIQRIYDTKLLVGHFLIFERWFSWVSRLVSSHRLKLLRLSIVIRFSLVLQNERHSLCHIVRSWQASLKAFCIFLYEAF